MTVYCLFLSCIYFLIPLASFTHVGFLRLMMKRPPVFCCLKTSLMNRLQVNHIAKTFNVHLSVNKDVLKGHLNFPSSTQMSPQDGNVSLEKLWLRLKK